MCHHAAGGVYGELLNDAGHRRGESRESLASIGLNLIRVELMAFGRGKRVTVAQQAHRLSTIGGFGLLCFLKHELGL